MSHHNTRQAFRNHFFVGIQLYIIESFLIKVNRRQCLMRILSGISMSRKMFSTREYSSAVLPFYKSNCLICHVLFIFSKRAIPNDRVQWIGIDIYHRSKIKMHPYPSTMLCYLLPRFHDQTVILHSA